MKKIKKELLGLLLIPTLALTGCNKSNDKKIANIERIEAENNSNTYKVTYTDGNLKATAEYVITFSDKIESLKQSANAVMVVSGELQRYSNYMLQEYSYQADQSLKKTDFSEYGEIQDEAGSLPGLD